MKKNKIVFWCVITPWIFWILSMITLLPFFSVLSALSAVFAFVIGRKAVKSACPECGTVFAHNLGRRILTVTENVSKTETQSAHLQSSTPVQVWYCKGCGCEFFTK